MMKSARGDTKPSHDWITITGHEGIPEYNAISDPHCPVARTPAVLKLCEQHAAPIPQKKKNPEVTGGGGGPHHSHSTMCSRQKRAMDFISKQKRLHGAAGSHGGAQQQGRRPKKMIKRWNLSTIDEQSESNDEEDEDAYIGAEGKRGGGTSKASASPPRNRDIESVLENWSEIRDDISGCWAFYGINAVYLDKKRDEDTKLFEGVQRLYDREDDARQAEASARDRVLKRERLAKIARERRGSDSVDPLSASTVNSRLRTNEKPPSPRGGRQQSSSTVVEPKAPPMHAQKGNPRHSTGSGSSGMFEYVAPFGSLHQQQSSSQPPIPKPPPRRPFQPQPDTAVRTAVDPPVDNTTPVEVNTTKPTAEPEQPPPVTSNEELVREPSINAPSEMILEAEASSSPTTSNPPRAIPPPISNSGSFKGRDVVLIDENSPDRPVNTQHQFTNVQTQHINDLIDDDVNSPSRPAAASYEEEEEL